MIEYRHKQPHNKRLKMQRVETMKEEIIEKAIDTLDSLLEFEFVGKKDKRGYEITEEDTIDRARQIIRMIKDIKELSIEELEDYSHMLLKLSERLLDFI